MSRRKPGDDGDTSRQPDTSGRGRRRAGRTPNPADFRSRYGDPGSTQRPETGSSAAEPAHSGLHEPRATDRYVRGRNRLTVRELMEQMEAEGRNAPTPGSTPAPPHSPPPAREPRQPAADDSPTTAHHFGGALDANELTQRIPTVGGPNRGVDISEEATRERVVAESRAQDVRTSAPQPATRRPEQTPAAEPKLTAPADQPTSGSEAESTEQTGSPEPAVAASAAAATEKFSSRPLQRTPDLTERLRARPSRLPSSAASRRRRFARDATVTGRILTATACVLALIGTGFVWGYMQSVNGNWNNIDAIDTNDQNIRKKDQQYGDETYLIVGTDTRGGNNSKVGAGTTADAEGARSDTVILVNIPANRSRVVAVSFPRDLQVNRPECQNWDNDSGTYNGDLPGADAVKLNSVYAEGGPQCLVKVLTQMSGLNINHFIAMDFYGFEKVVRSVGGVEVCSTTPLYDYELGQILKKSGKQKVTGRRALNYVRARMVSTEGNGDYGRIKRQQLFMSSLLRSTLSGDVLANPTKLNSIVNTFIQYSYVDKVDTQSLLNLAESMQGMDAGRVTFVTIPTSGTAEDGSNNEIPRTDDINAIFDAIIDDTPLPGEKKAAADTTSTEKKSSSSTKADETKADAPSSSRVTGQALSPGEVGVRVLNGTGTAGAAADVSDKLTPLGFDVRGVADASQNSDTTVIRYGTGEQNAAATVAAMIPGSSIQLDKTVKSGIEIIIGADFSLDDLTDPPTAGESISVSQLPEAQNAGNLPNDLAVTNAGDTTCA